MPHHAVRLVRSRPSLQHMHTHTTRTTRLPLIGITGNKGNSHGLPPLNGHLAHDTIYSISSRPSSSIGPARLLHFPTRTKSTSHPQSLHSPRSFLTRLYSIHAHPSPPDSPRAIVKVPADDITVNFQDQTSHLSVSSIIQGVVANTSLAPSSSSSGGMDLVSSIKKLICERPITPLSHLVAFHDNYPTQQSTESYNILIRHSLRVTAYGTAARLRNDMRLRNIPPDPETTRLTVRLLVRMGKWQDAWKICWQWRSTPGHPSTALIWLELLGYADQPSIGGLRKAKTLEPHVNEEFKLNPPPEWIAGVLDGLLTMMPSDAGHWLSAHYAYMTALLSLRSGNDDAAKRLTKAWLSGLPKTMTRKQRSRCLNVIHLHLRYSPKTTKAHFKSRKLMNELFSLNVHLQPNSTTLFLLLRSLQKTKSRATIFAVQLVHAYVKRWGSRIIDKRVRRRICSIAIKEGQLKIAKKWKAREDRVAFNERREAISKEVLGNVRRVGGRHYGMLMPRRGEEGRKWRWLSRRLHRRLSKIRAGQRKKDT